MRFCKDAGKISSLSYGEVGTNTNSTKKIYESVNVLKKQTSKCRAVNTHGFFISANNSYFKLDGAQ